MGYNNVKLAMGAASIAFFFLYSYLSLTAPLLFNSPDEAINFYTAERFAAGETLGVVIPKHLRSYHYVNPRATFLQGERVMPGVFLGMPVVYGVIARAFGSVPVMGWLTAFFALTGAWALYFITARVFGSRVALFSFLLYVAAPPVWYYATRGFFHNVFFTSLLLVGLALVLTGAGKGGWKERVYSVGGALVIGGALWVRPSEAVWVWLALVAAYLVLQRMVRRVHVISVLLIVLVVGVGYFLFQKQLLGVWLAPGYATLFSSVSQNTVTVGEDTVWQSAWQNVSSKAATFLFPFGFAFKNIAFNFYHYFLRMFWWISAPAMLAVVWFLWTWNVRPRMQKAWCALTLVAGLFLVVVIYGNWLTYDTPNAQAVTIGNAHVRYWLPLYALAVPWAALFFDRAARLFVARLRWLPVTVCIAGIGFISWHTVWKGIDGIAAVRNNLESGNRMVSEVLARVGANDVVIVDREDKFLFPLRFVTRQWDYAGIKGLLRAGFGVWYLNARNEARFGREARFLAEHGLRMEEVAERPPHVLFRIIAATK